MRQIIVFTTKTNQKFKFQSDAKVWGELKPLVAEKISLRNLQATENVNSCTLEHQNAALPEGDFILFLRPIQTKSGISGTENLGFRALRKLVTTDSIKKHLSAIAEKKGKNWTQLSTDDLRKGLASYKEKGKKETIVKQEVEEIEEVVEKKSKPVKKKPIKKKITKKESEDKKEPAQNVQDTILEAIEHLSLLEIVTLTELLIQKVCDDSENEEVCDLSAGASEDLKLIKSELESKSEVKEDEYSIDNLKKLAQDLDSGF